MISAPNHFLIKSMTVHDLSCWLVSRLLFPLWPLSLENSWFQRFGVALGPWYLSLPATFGLLSIYIDSNHLMGFVVVRSWFKISGIKNCARKVDVYFIRLIGTRRSSLSKQTIATITSFQNISTSEGGGVTSKPKRCRSSSDNVVSGSSPRSVDSVDPLPG